MLGELNEATFATIRYQDKKLTMYEESTIMKKKD